MREAPAAADRERAPRRRRRWPVAALLLALLAAAHWLYWYRPRPRAAAPDGSALLAASPALPVRLWIPFPHQNLGALERSVERPDEVLAAAARLLDLPPPSLPRLPGLGWPPASELLVVASRDGERGVAALRMYPAAAVVVRLAGILASNPWLAGGEVEASGRPAVVRWEGRTWRLERGGGSVGGSGERGEPPETGEPLLALLEIDEPAPPLPAGRYALRFENGEAGADLVWRLGQQRLQGRPAPSAEPRPVLVLVRRRGVEGGPGTGRAEALLLLDREGGLLSGLPAAAAWTDAGSAADALPGGALLARLAGLRTERLGSGEVAATDGAALGAALGSAAGWLPLAEGRSSPPVAFGAWLEIAPAAQRARQVERALERVPLFGEAEAQRWGDIALVLEAAGRFRRLECWLAADRAGGELRFVR